jgi:hypothetical protein
VTLGALRATHAATQAVCVCVCVCVCGCGGGGGSEGAAR